MLRPPPGGEFGARIGQPAVAPPDGLMRGDSGNDSA
jgi:hypothetical protein